jgi:hypothetical protein
MIKQGSSCVDSGQGYYEKRYRSQVIQNKKMKRKVQEAGFELVAILAGKNPRMKITIKDTWKVAQKKRVVL